MGQGLSDIQYILCLNAYFADSSPRLFFSALQIAIFCLVLKGKQRDVQIYNTIHYAV